MAKQKFRPIEGCMGYAIGSHGQVKRLRHLANGKYHKMLPEKIVKQIYDRYLKPTVRIINNDGKQVQLSVEKLVIKNFLEPGYSYYKTTFDNRINKVDFYIRVDLYVKMKDKPTVYKIVKS
jgi:hypothetical protein